jgi:hypothetical protein
MTQGKQQKINYKLEKYRKIPRENWIIAEGTHEPIIDKDDFELIQELIQKKILHYHVPERAEHMLNGFIYCKDCGMKMTYRRNKQKKMCVVCMTYSKFGVAHCSSHLMNEEVIEKYVIADLRRTAKKALKKGFSEQFEGLELEETDSGEKEQLENRLSAIKDIIKNLYEDKLKAIIDEDLFIEMSSKYNVEKINLANKLMHLENQALKPTVKYDYKSIIEKITNFEIIDRGILAKLINKIEISNDKEIFITYNFCQPRKTS